MAVTLLCFGVFRSVFLNVLLWFPGFEFVTNQIWPWGPLRALFSCSGSYMSDVWPGHSLSNSACPTTSAQVRPLCENISYSYRVHSNRVVYYPDSFNNELHKQLTDCTRDQEAQQVALPLKLLGFLPYSSKSTKYVTSGCIPLAILILSKSCLFKNKITEIFRSHLHINTTDKSISTNIKRRKKKLRI